jgi:hypothetical protein
MRRDTTTASHDVDDTIEDSFAAIDADLAAVQKRLTKRSTAQEVEEMEEIVRHARLRMIAVSRKQGPASMVWLVRPRYEDVGGNVVRMRR